MSMPYDGWNRPSLPINLTGFTLDGVASMTDFINEITIRLILNMFFNENNFLETFPV